MIREGVGNKKKNKSEASTQKTSPFILPAKTITILNGNFSPYS